MKKKYLYYIGIIILIIIFFLKSVVKWEEIILILSPSAPNNEYYTDSNVNYKFNYKSFDEYRELVKGQVLKHRIFITDDHEKELNAILPYELKPVKNLDTYNYNTNKYRRGILLIHGLAGTPYDFKDIAKNLQSQGYFVRTIMLIGHGSKPGNLSEVDYRKWEVSVNIHTDLIKKEVDTMYLGGFSLGAVLAYLKAQECSDVTGLLLFSPAFETRSNFLSLVKYIEDIKPWLRVEKNLTLKTDYTQFFDFPTEAAVALSYYIDKASTAMQSKTFDKPTLFVLSEHDRILNTHNVRKFFEERFINKHNKLVWYGTSFPSSKNILFIPAENKASRRTNMSHKGILFHHKNPYYGINGSQRVCRSNKGDSNSLELCLKASEVWYAAPDTYYPERIHALTTFNYEFDLMMKQVPLVFGRNTSLPLH